MWKFGIVIFAVIALVITGTWIMHGKNMYTKEKTMVIVKTVNPNFGNTEEHFEWKDEMRLGMDIAGPCISLAVFCSLGSFWMMRRQISRTSNAK